jgi:hypothetical protein
MWNNASERGGAARHGAADGKYNARSPPMTVNYSIDLHLSAPRTGGGLGCHAHQRLKIVLRQDENGGADDRAIALARHAAHSCE